MKHDHAQHTTQQPSPGLRYLTVRINEQADDDDTGTLSPSNTGTSWSTVMLPWMSQQIDAMIALTKPDYSNIFACLDAYSQASMTAQSQALSDIIKLPTELFATSLSTQIQTIFESVKPDYSNIFAGLGAYCQVSKMSPPQGLADIFKLDGNAMVASFGNLQIPDVVTQYPDLTTVMPIVQKSIGKINTGILDIWATQISSVQQSFANSRRSLRPQLFYTHSNNHHMCEDILWSIHPAVLNAYLGIFSDLEQMTPDYAAKTVFSIRRVLDIATKVIVGEVHKDQMRLEINKKNRWHNRCYFGKNGPNLYMRLVYISVVYGDTYLNQHTIEKIVDFCETLGALHDVSVNATNDDLFGYIKTLQAIVCEDIARVVNSRHITPTS